jgi:hypothetical protein
MSCLALIAIADNGYQKEPATKNILRKTFDDACCAAMRPTTGRLLPDRRRPFHPCRDRTTIFV